jgi:hypothetical protein
MDIPLATDATDLYASDSLEAIANLIIAGLKLSRDGATLPDEGSDSVEAPVAHALLRAAFTLFVNACLVFAGVRTRHARVRAPRASS